MQAVSINNRGHMEIGGCDTVKLTAKYGTPLYVVDEGMVRRNCALYRDTLEKHYPDSMVAFAGKSFLPTAMCRLVEEEGLGLDTVSGGEIYTALQANFPPEKIIFHGNNKSVHEIMLALNAGVGRFVVDSFSELQMLSQLATSKNLVAQIYLRVNPAIEPDTHEFIQTGQMDSKFGFGIDDQVMEAVEMATDLPGLNLLGLHCHIGSQIHDLAPFTKAAASMVDLMLRIRRENGLVLKELDLGGGLGIRYLPNDKTLSIPDYVKAVATTVKKRATQLDLPLPKLILEPGRSIVGEAGITLFKIGSWKEVPGVRKYVAVDGGMMSDLRPALYGARYHAVLANRPKAPAQETVTIAGKACESGDILIKDIKLPHLSRGDVLAVLSTGAYHYSMANNYNRFGKPAVVFVRDDKSELVVSRETYADLTKNDIMPAHMLRKGEKSGA